MIGGLVLLIFAFIFRILVAQSPQSSINYSYVAEYQIANQYSIFILVELNNYFYYSYYMKANYDEKLKLLINNLVIELYKYQAGVERKK